MNIIAFGIELYFAAMLGVSGLAKIADPNDFAATLHRHGVLPKWSIKPVSRIFPWLEVVLAGALLIGIAPVVTAALTIALFTIFLLIEIFLVVTRRATDCGCYGVAFRQKVDGASIVVSSILIAVASAHLWLTTWVAPLGQPWRLLAVVVMGMAGGWLLWRVKRRQMASRQHYSRELASQ